MASAMDELLQLKWDFLRLERDVLQIILSCFVDLQRDLKLQRDTLKLTHRMVRERNSIYCIRYQVAERCRHDLQCMLLDKYERWKALPLPLLEDITNRFSEDVQICRGVFGVVYKGILSRPFDQNHIWNPEFVSQMDPIWISRATSVRNVAVFDGLHDVHPVAVGVAKGQTIKRNSSAWCAPVKMLLFGEEIKVLVLRQSLNLMTRYLKWNATFRCVSSLLILTEAPTFRCFSSLLILTGAPTKKKTVANGNGEGADNGSSEDVHRVSSNQANHGSNASAETPMSQSEQSSISRSAEPATADNSSLMPSRTPESTWYIASAAAHHMTGVLDLLANYTPMSGELVVHTPNMGCMQVLGSGSVNTANITLQDVWYVPGLDANLVSTNQLTKLGHTVSLGPYGCRINKDSEDGALIGSAHFTENYLFAVDFLNVQPTN